MKRCRKCQIEKPITDFYKHSEMADGHLNICKNCTRNRVTDYRNRHLEQIRTYDRERSKEPHRIEAMKKRAREYRRSYPARYHANTRANNALRSGQLTKEPCASCGTEKVHAHHEDYSKPLQVIWLCAVCHSAWHRKDRND